MHHTVAQSTIEGPDISWRKSAGKYPPLRRTNDEAHRDKPCDRRNPRGTPWEQPSHCRHATHASPTRSALARILFVSKIAELPLRPGETRQIPTRRRQFHSPRNRLRLSRHLVISPRPFRENDPIVQWPRTPPFHGGNTGSNPVRVATLKIRNLRRER